MKKKQQDFQSLVNEVLNHKPFEEENEVKEWRVTGEITNGKKFNEVIPARSAEEAKKGMYDSAKIFGHEIKEIMVEPVKN